jgi:hypothetical protein
MSSEGRFIAGSVIQRPQPAMFLADRKREMLSTTSARKFKQNRSHRFRDCDPDLESIMPSSHGISIVSHKSRQQPA